MHDPGTIMLSSLPKIIAKVCVKYLSQRVFRFEEKLNRQKESGVSINSENKKMSSIEENYGKNNSYKLLKWTKDVEMDLK